MKKIYFYYILTTFIVLLIPNAKSKAVNNTMPKFESTFRQLENNRARYNRLNDSIFTKMEETEWIKLMLHRADVNYSMYNKNTSLLDNITYYFLQKPVGVKVGDATSGHLKLKPNIPEEAYDSLWSAMLNHKACLDPFIGEIFIGNILIPHYESLNKNDLNVCAKLARHYLNYGDCLYSIFCMGDSSALPKANNMFRKCIKVSGKRLNGRQEWVCQMFAMAHILSRPRLIRAGKIRETEADSMAVYYTLRYNEKKAIIMNDFAYSYYKQFTDMALNYSAMRTRELILNESNLNKIETSELWRRLELVHNKMAGNYLPQMWNGNNYSCYHMFKARLGAESYNAALDSCLAQYKSLDFNTAKDYTSNFRGFIYTVKDILYLLDKSTYPDVMKQKIRYNYANLLMKVLKERPHAQLQAQDTNLLMILLLDERLFKNMKVNDRKKYVRQCFAATQVHTLAHYQSVTNFTKVILEAVITDHPELLKGTLDFDPTRPIKIEEMRRNMWEGSMTHDLGKIRMTPIMANEYRRLTDHEFEIIKKHPEYSRDFYGILPSVVNFRDYAIGHHKWYNGKGGYPVWYDNTTSPIKVLVDILTIADSMEAATNRMSRNYRKCKSYDQIMTEFQGMAGTRYNPDIINVILNSQKATSTLSDLVYNGWKTVFANIFHEQMR